MRLEDVPEVVAVDRRCFTNPWPASAYRREVTHPDKNLYIVLKRVGEGPLTQPDPKGNGFLTNILPFLKDDHGPSEEPIIGYAGLWIVGDEAHVTTIGVLPEFRGLGLGELLLVTLVEHARAHGARWMTLEARVSNTGAHALYRKYTFKDAGYRRRYYSDDGEDALVMWSDRIDTPEFGRQLGELRERLQARLNGSLLAVSV
jgi:ribosomal-protein-alanine N-acetyltransferase